MVGSVEEALVVVEVEVVEEEAVVWVVAQDRVEGLELGVVLVEVWEG